MITLDDLTPAQRVAVEAHILANRCDDDDVFQYADNHRLARKGNAAEEAEYARAEDAGCCGSYDDEIETPDGVVMYGFNYGH